jgi:hypothetical protein
MKQGRIYIAGLAFALLGGMAENGSAEPVYEISVSDISYQKVYKNWLLIPKEVDLRVTWTITEKEVVGGRQRELIREAADLPLTYQVYLTDRDSDAEPSIREITGSNYADFAKRPVGGRFGVRVRAYGENSTLVAESEIASILIGKGEDGLNDPELNKGLIYYLHPGRWQLAGLGKAEIYDQSTELGKVAFIFLSLTAVMGMVVLVYYASRTLYLGNVFPFKRSKGNFLWSFTLSCDKAYEQRLTTKFRFILSAWEVLASKSRRVADQAVKSIPRSLSSTEKMASVDVACMEYWTSDGDRAIGTIGDILSFPDHLNGSTEGTPEDQLTELVVRIEGDFQELVCQKNGTANGAVRPLSHAEFHFDHKDMGTLVDEIYEPVVRDHKPLSKFKRWILRRGLFDVRGGMFPYPTTKIIKAGLEIHRMNGHRWLSPSEEVKRAFEDRASSEIEILRRKAKIEWFWNYGALAPLVGLFGTVTGITYAFQQLSMSAGTPDFMHTIQLLSNGIFEALWTTIFGLANGISFVIIYYYYRHKLDWIYSKWEEIYVSITEKV